MPRRDRRADIMRAAEKLFTSRRYHEISLDDVVQLARVGKGTIYRYFKNKEDLFFQTASSGFDQLCDLLSRKVPERGSFPEQLLSACLNIGQFFARRRQLFRMMQSEEARMYWRHGEVRQRWIEGYRKLVRSVAVIIDKGVREGLMRDDVSAEILASFLLGMLRTRARALADVPDEDRPFELVVDLFCNGAQRNDASIRDVSSSVGGEEVR
ncbi:MAG TPA: TetR/AcrR family transcriptional regulator [Planctomycetota bacterium]|nr:TetR/AcrR family transcriptional regulator [Planctomycetota bacterium]